MKSIKSGKDYKDMKTQLKGIKNANQVKSNYLNKNQKHLYV